MRVTEGRMMDLASEAVSQARDRSAAAAEKLSSGIQVAVPSDDPTAWAEGMRAEVRKTLSGFRGSAIATSRQRLEDSDRALGTIIEVLDQAIELGVEMGNDTHTAIDRINGATAMRSLRDQLLAAANTRDNNGQYLLAGTLGGQPAFAASGAFAGDAIERSIEVGEGAYQVASISGSLLTAAAGLAVHAVVDGLATAMANNDAPGIRAALASLHQAVAQVAGGRATAGVRMKALDDAESARLDLDLNLDQIRARALAADPITAATEFTKGRQALEAAQAVAEQIVALTRPR